MRNPGFAADTAGWNTAGSSDGVTLSRSADGRDGAGAAVVTNTGSSAATCALNDSPNIVHTTAAGTYTATVWVRPDTPGATLKLRLREWSGDTALGQARTTVTLTTTGSPSRSDHGGRARRLDARLQRLPAGSSTGDLLRASIAVG